MAAKPKVNLLKDMDITEISLVTAPMCPEADILFTKGELTAITGDVQIGKVRDTSKEARDPKGRWTVAAIAAIGGKSGSYRRQVAQAFSDKARAIAHGTIAHTVHAVKTTRPTGANPVEGGGVQFSFEHHLKEAEGQPAGSGTRVHTKVQIRPEHLGPHPTETPNKAQKALYTLHRVLHTFKRPMEQPFGGKTALSYLRASVNPADIGNAAHRLFSSGTSGSGPGTSPAPTSDEAPSGGFGWRPHEMVPAWSNRVRGRAPSGTGIKVNQHDVDSPHIPLKDNHTARTAGGWAHYTEYGNFIPTGSPDIQEHIERVHQELAQKSPEERANFIQSHRGNASANTSGGGYFTQRGDYIPPVRALDNEQRAKHQRGWEIRYGHEIGRRETQATPAVAPAHTPLPFEPAKTSLAPMGSRQYEYDTGTPEQRAAAQRAAREDMRKILFAPVRKSMFAVPKGFPVTRVPTVPHVPTLKWNIDKGVPSFGPAETAPNTRQSYLNGVVKSKLRHG